jgi:hypothetical protein
MKSMNLEKDKGHNFSTLAQHDDIDGVSSYNGSWA